MQIVWTSAAVIDLEQISDYIFEKNPRLAATTIRRIHRIHLRTKTFSPTGTNRPQRRYAGIGFNATALPSCL
jgi:plasmid stabilization system protein ParE